ncbi:MAG TPA: efflux RND transporter periplasmic adaptor subunit [Candidatus Saccharimonadales bacterium]|nr:efflux RND transporter periplasmic adaptor subunit [Candidatus Saccharimonadales bacterium]
MANGRRRLVRRCLILGVVLLAVGGSWGYYHYTHREVIITVQTEKVTRRSLTERVVANGRIYPVLQVKISPEVSGEIIELPVKEGTCVKKGDLLVRIRPDYYQANRRSAEAGFQAAVANKDLAAATLRKAEVEHRRHSELLTNQLISESTYLDAKTSKEVAQAAFESTEHQINVAKASLSRADEDLSKTTIVSPIDGTVSKLNSQQGERVVGTAMMTGTEMMVVADLNDMEARVDVGEVDVVLIAVGQKAWLETEAFRDRKFAGVVTEIANSSRNLGQPQAGGGGGGMGGQQQQEATRFEVKIRIQEKETFRPGMSVTAEVETRSRTNVLCVPIQSVTTRVPKEPSKTNASATATVTPSAPPTPPAPGPVKERKPGENAKPIEVVFLTDGDHVRTAPVKRGISDDDYTEILEGLNEGQEVISGGFKAISRDLEDGKRFLRGEPERDKSKDKDKDKEKK